MALTGLMLLAAPGVTTTAHGAGPSVLVHCPRPSIDQWYWWVDLEYLRELRAAGFEVDYTDRHQDFTWERVRRYDVLVIYTVPIARGAYYDNSPDRPPYRDEFIGIVERFLDEGGGVLLMARSLNADETFLPLIRPWGARIAHERIVEEDPARLAPLPRMRGVERLWLTDGVVESPVSAGVEQVWLPLTPHYSAAETMPIVVDDRWRPVLRGSSTSRTEPVDPPRTPMLPPPARLARSAGVRAPDLFAIREYRRGRIAFCAIWPQYSLGQGTQWLYERRVLSRGLRGEPSHFGRLLENTLRWLAEPAQRSEALGGFVTDPARLVPHNERPGALVAFRARRHHHGVREPEPLHAGLIGAQSALGSGSGSVADYASAARKAGLRFVVFLEDFAELDDARFSELMRECRDHSGRDLLLLPGYRIETNAGSRMFVFGTGAALPPAGLVLDGRLSQQQDATSRRIGHRSSLVDWLNHRLLATRQVNVGYYGFDDRPLAPGLPDLRFYSMVAARLYEDGRLVEDNLDAYLTTAAGTIPPAPAAVHLVVSPDSLAAAARREIGLTYAQARSVEALWGTLGYADQYAAPNVFASDGPRILAWPAQNQYYTFAAERFVTDEARMPSAIDVRSDVGLREIRIYDGDRLFRRFLPGGARRYRQVLELTASVQRTLVLVAEDVEGGRAVSFARRGWKAGGLAPIFCGDRVNDCVAAPLMAKAPGIVQVSRIPTILAGYTWDGGPVGTQPILRFDEAHRPTLVSSAGREGERGFNARTVLELSDEAAVRVRTSMETLYDPRIPVINPWKTFGPLAGPSRLLRAEAAFTTFHRPTVGPHPDRYAGFARRAGAAVSIFECTVTFKKEQTIESLRLFRQGWYRGPFPIVLLHGRGSRVLEARELPASAREGEIVVRTGDWIGAYGPEPTNLSVHVNRGAPMRLVVHGTESLSVAFEAAAAGTTVRAGDRLRFEWLSVVDPVDAASRDAERIARIVSYLREPQKIEVRRGRRLDSAESPGLIELEADDGVAALAVGRPAPAHGAPLPVRVRGLNPRWSAGVLLERGYVLGNYGPPKKRYREAGFDHDGRVYEVLYPDLARSTSVRIGNPVVSDRPELFIQVTRLDDRGSAGSWHVSVNNPTDDEIRATFRTTMKLRGLSVDERPRTIPAGGYVVLR